jgi:uncharacterized protein (TIGR02118 family)
MISRFSIICRRSDLSPEAFTRHWKTTHADLARKMPGVRSYWQNHIARRVFETPNFPLQRIDGIAQQRFDDRAAVKVAEDSPEYAAVKKDIPEFQGGITILVVESHTLIENSVDDTTPKLFVIGRLKAGAVADWQAEWRRQMKVAFSALPGTRRLVTNIVTDRGRPVGASVPQGEANADTILEVWFDSPAALDACLASASVSAALKGPIIESICVYQTDVFTVV